MRPWGASEAAEEALAAALGSAALVPPALALPELRREGLAEALVVLVPEGLTARVAL